MSEFLSFYDSVMVNVTPEHRKVFECDVEMRKKIIEQAYVVKQRRYAEKLAIIDKRAAILKKRRKIEHLKMAAMKKSAYQKFLVRLDLNNDMYFYKRQKMITDIKKKDKEKGEKLAKFKQHQLRVKQKKEVERYWVTIDRQKKMMQNRNLLIDKCIKETVSDETIYLEEINEVEEEIEMEPESSEDCSFYKNIDHIQYNTDGSIMSKFIERMEKLKMNFSTCEQGKAFWNKTQPLWNKMTHCLENLLTNIESKESGPISKAYQEQVEIIQESMKVKAEPMSLLMQKIMLNDVNYNLSDEMLIEIMKTAKSLSDVGATAAEVIHLTRCVVEFKADSKVNVGYMVHGLIERSVFEFTKKQIAKKIFVDARKCIDRLQHVNDEGVIPKKMLKSKSKIEVTLFVKNMIDNDEIYEQFDEPIDDDKDFVNLDTGLIIERMDQFMKDNLLSFTNTQLKPKLSMKMFPMNKRHILIKLIDKTIASFLELAHQKTAIQVTTVKGNQFAEDFKRKCVRTSKVTMVMVYRICRKLAKLLFGMFSSVDQKLRNIEKMADAYMSLMTKRTPRVVYDRRVYHPPVKFDLSYFQRSFDAGNPRNLPVKSRNHP